MASKLPWICQRRLGNAVVAAVGIGDAAVNPAIILGVSRNDTAHARQHHLSDSKPGYTIGRAGRGGAAHGRAAEWGGEGCGGSGRWQVGPPRGQPSSLSPKEP